MAFFKRVQKKVNDLWYPQSVTWGKAVTTREVADELSVLSTVTRGDTYAVMENLGRVANVTFRWSSSSSGRDLCWFLNHES